jgi:hypothetical protein
VQLRGMRVFQGRERRARPDGVLPRADWMAVARSVFSNMGACKALRLYSNELTALPAAAFNGRKDGNPLVDGRGCL